MRLIRTKPPLELQEFTENELPKYAILSHRWEREEVTFQEVIRSHETIKSKAGYKKIGRFCARAHQDGLEYAWIDTCCINKESSAELSEAINSMFRWYEQVEKCYAYLCDAELATVHHSSWFQRGWTLQELLAPCEVYFLASDWSDLGTRTMLCSLINEITGSIIAKRMSWASARQTTRIEDIAYCLMGIFGVNMPLLYGEGEKAFIRLQEGIMRDSDDQTLFAWENEDISKEHPSGLLARSPADFRSCSDIVPFFFSNNGTPFALTNRGIRMHLPLIRVEQGSEATTMLILECHSPELLRRSRSSHRLA
ncbi:HET-domain-containing protein [Aspergillus novoparasiticus]|uniref:HET-domain-containing protein n=1 Tax=Aspergillus novoparasiticus TaxID=986946 RepID=A0A5N6ECN6_9EURO|nr:HET-domain-containing protein [Aspergillus novoparasiticus]